MYYQKITKHLLLLIGNGRAALLTLLLVSPTLSQPVISPSIREGTSSPSGAEKVIEQYLEHWAKELEADSSTSVRKIREALTEPLRAPGSDIFKLAYSSRLSSHLKPILKSDDVVVRLNAIMAVRHLVDPGAVPLIEAALADMRLGSSAIRLHAARSTVRLAETGRLSPKGQHLLVASLSTAYQSERSQSAIEEIMKALGALSTDAAESTDKAAEVLLDIINARTALHAMNPKLPIHAEREGMNRLATEEMKRQMGENRRDDDEARIRHIRQMLQVGHRYLRHCATWLSDAESDDPLRNDHERTAKLSDQILRLAMKVLDDQARLPDKVDPEISKGRWEEVLLRCAEWEKVLTQHGFTAEQLQIPPKEQHN